MDSTISVPSVSLGGQATSVMSKTKNQWPTIGSKDDKIVIEARSQTNRCWRDSRNPKTFV